MSQKKDSRHRCCFALLLSRTGDSMISQRYKLFAKKHPVNKLPTKNPQIPFILLQTSDNIPQHLRGVKLISSVNERRVGNKQIPNPKQRRPCRQMCAWRLIEQIPVYLQLASGKSPAHTCLRYHIQHLEI